MTSNGIVVYLSETYQPPTAYFRLHLGITPINGTVK